MKNILTVIAIVLIPFIALANTYSKIKELTDRIKTNSECYRLICYGNRNTMKLGGKLDIENREQYCIYLKSVIENDIDKVLELEKENINN
jgi:hypothetical protein